MKKLLLIVLILFACDKESPVESNETQGVCVWGEDSPSGIVFTCNPLFSSIECYADDYINSWVVDANCEELCSELLEKEDTYQCNVVGEENSINNVLNGYVADQDGNPIEDAKVMLTYNFNENVNLNRVMPSTDISISIGSSSQTRVWIEDYCNEFIVELVNDVIDAGSYTIQWDATDLNGNRVKNGMYRAKIEVEGYNDEQLILLNSNDFIDSDNYENIEFEATSDSNGLFSIVQTCLPFGEHITITDSFGNELMTSEISRSLTVVVVHSNYQDKVLENVYFPSQGMQLDITLEPNP